ncbi:MAG: hypothetical protein ACTSU2_15170 [Promethearchaeota archaeon]
MSQKQTTVTSSRDALIRVGALGIFIAGLFQFFVGIRFISVVNAQDVELLSYILLFVSGLFMVIISIMAFAREWLSFKINIGFYAATSLVDLILTYFIPGKTSSYAMSIYIGNGVFGFIGLGLLFIGIRPNFGPTANKKIYQAVAGIIAFTNSIILFILGIYVTAILDIADFAGRGTYPGDFVYAFIEPIPNNAGIATLNNIRLSGQIMIIISLLVIVIVMLRNKISLKVASIGLLVGIGLTIFSMSFFLSAWDQMDNLFRNYYRAEYTSTLILSDPGVTSTGTVLIVIYTISFLMMLYASFAAKPIDKWRRSRDSAIAAAEVFFREGKLPNAIKYLERAAELSSKIDEEDKAVELLTRIKQIRDKAIKMKKAEAAEKAKKEYEKAKSKAKGSPKKVSAKDKETEEKMRQAMMKKTAKKKK